MYLWTRVLKNQDRFIGRLTARDRPATKAIENRSDAGTDGYGDDSRSAAALACETAINVLLITRTSRRRMLTICYSSIGFSRRIARTGSARDSRKPPISWKGTTKCSEELEGMEQITLDNADAQVKASLKSWDTKLRSPRTGSRSSNPLKGLGRFLFGCAAGACCRERPAPAYHLPPAVTATMKTARVLKRGVKQQQLISTTTA